MRRPARLATLTGLLAAAALLLSSCTVPRPVVTFYGNRTAVDVEPELWCQVDTTALTVSCPPSPDTANDGHLTCTTAHVGQHRQWSSGGGIVLADPADFEHG